MNPPSYDVVVVGGGLAGFAAATTAAESGARTLLVEAGDRLGGNVTQAFVHTLCGLYELAATGGGGGAGAGAGAGDEPVHAHPSLPRRLAKLLVANGAAGEAERAGPVWVLPTYPPAVARTLAQSITSLEALEWRRENSVIAAKLARDGDASPQRLTLSTPAGEHIVTAHIVIDTSGDGAVAAAAGAATDREPPERLQFPSYILRLAGVGDEDLRGFGRLRLSHAVAGAVRAGELPAGCEAVLVRPGATPGEAYLTVNVPKLEGATFDPLDRHHLDALEARGRENGERIVAHLAQHRPGFRGARIAEHPARIGIRETRRVRGRAVMTEEDILGGRQRPDAVARSTWPVELWHDHRRSELRIPSGAASIPLDALVAVEHPRLGMAGRCMSATHEAMGALRVLGTALATGEAIGAAAALAAERGMSLAEIAPADVRGQIQRLVRGDDA